MEQAAFHVYMFCIIFSWYLRNIRVGVESLFKMSFSVKLNGKLVVAVSVLTVFGASGPVGSALWPGCCICMSSTPPAQESQLMLAPRALREPVYCTDRPLGSVAETHTGHI